MGAIPWRFLRDRKINDRLSRQLLSYRVILSAGQSPESKDPFSMQDVDSSTPFGRSE